ncbi:MAG: glycosyltransferase, partial [Ignavibacteriaceae bacterium]
MGAQNYKFINVSIIIVNYNQLKLLHNCLLSIFNNIQSLSYEIIVVDNCSTEGNVEDVTKQYDNVTLIKNNENIGFAAANNIGLQHANGKYILFLNNDTVFYENSLKEIFDF